jgi:Flp pilus assembly pilin Flp
LSLLVSETEGYDESMGRGLRRDEKGATLAQYGLLLALIAVAVIASVGKTGRAVSGAINVDLEGAISRPVNVLPFTPKATPAQGNDSHPGDSAQDAGDRQHRDQGKRNVHDHGGGGSVDEKD